jgi:hypothetical protein
VAQIAKNLKKCHSMEFEDEKRDINVKEKG